MVWRDVANHYRRLFHGVAGTLYRGQVQRRERCNVR